MSNEIELRRELATAYKRLDHWVQRVQEIRSRLKAAQGTETETVPRLRTSVRIAEHLGISAHAVTRLIRAHNIQPTARVGRIRVYDREALAQIYSLVSQEEGKR